MYLYDMTRLLRRSLACVKNNNAYTGIDRVVLRYAQFFLTKPTLFIIQHQNKFIKMEQQEVDDLLALADQINTKNERIHLPKSISTLSKKLSLKKDPTHFIKPTTSNKINLQTITSLFSKILGYISLTNLFYPKSWLEIKPLPKNKEITYINVGHTFYHEKCFSWLLSKTPCRFIFMIHDVLAITHPEFVPETSDVFFMKGIMNVTQFADTILFISDHARKAFLQVTQKHGIVNPNIKMKTLYLGTEDTFMKNEPAPPPSAPIQQLVGKLKGNYFIYVGTIEPRKNHLLLLNLWKRETPLREDWPTLILIGKDGWCNENIKATLSRAHDMEKVLYLKSVSDPDLHQLLIHANASLLTSFIEGWGLPITEAMSLGVPVICSDIQIFHENCNSIAEYIDPLDTETWKTMILEYSKKDSPLRKAQKERIQTTFKPNTWEDHFSQLTAFLEDN